MKNKPKSLHFNPVGENWEVESDAITLGQAETKSAAIELVGRAGVRGRGVKQSRPFFGRL
jgi:hypothetical protein